MTSLVLLTGLPATGKSIVAQKLAEDYGFAILSTDDLRQSLFREDYEKTRKNGKIKEEVVRKVLDYSKLKLLTEGFNLVVDACSPTDKFRKRMFGLPENLSQVVNKYLLHIKADKSVVYSRQKSRGRTPEAIETIQGFWQEPRDEFLGANLYDIENSRDLEELYKQVKMFYEGRS